MRSAAFVSFFLLICIQVQAQQGCPEFSSLKQQAEEFARQGKYREALNKYNTAKTCLPSRGKEIDERIDSLFIEIDRERIKAQEDDKKIKDMLTKLQQKEAREKDLEQQKLLADSSSTVERFKHLSGDWVNYEGNRDYLFSFVTTLSRNGKKTDCDSLATCLKLYHYAYNYDSIYRSLLSSNNEALGAPDFWKDRTEAVHIYDPWMLDYYYYLSLHSMNSSEAFLPRSSTKVFDPVITGEKNMAGATRKETIRNYWMPDTLIALPTTKLFSRMCADNQNYTWGWRDEKEYRNLKIRMYNLSLTKFALTVDSSYVMPDLGYYDEISNTAPEFRYFITTRLKYVLRKNRVDYQQLPQAKVIKLMDRAGNVLEDFSRDSASAFFFSPDAQYLATWNDGSQMILYNIPAKRTVMLPFSINAPALSFSPDSKKIAYFNQTYKKIYVSDVMGHALDQFPSYATGITNLEDLDFTGDDLLKVVSKDSIALYDLRAKSILFKFSREFAEDIKASPDNKKFLITCNAAYTLSNRKYTGNLTLLTNAHLDILERMYTDCPNLTFTPDGTYIVGYGTSVIMRWNVQNRRNVTNPQGCMTVAELIRADALPYNLYSAIDEANVIETGAREFQSMALAEPDTALKSLYFQEARSLFQRLAVGNAKNIPRERIPIYYDWYGWVERQLGQKNYNEQFTRQQAAVGLLDNVINSGDSVYPQLLAYTAYADLLLEDLYDSLHAYTPDLLTLIRKDLSLRQKVFEVDPDNLENIRYYREALVNLNTAYGYVGSGERAHQQYQDCLNLYRLEWAYFSGQMHTLPDSFNVKTSCVKSMSHLCSGFMFAYANRPGENAGALDSVIFWADKGLITLPGRSDSATLFCYKTFATVLTNGGLDQGMVLYRRFRELYPDWASGMTRDMLDLLKESGLTTTPNLSKFSSYLKQ